MNTISMSITPKAIQDLLDELEASKQSRLRAWSVLQRLRLVLSEMGSVAIPPPAQTTFDAEGEALEHALRKSFRRRNDPSHSCAIPLFPLVLSSTVFHTDGSFRGNAMENSGKQNPETGFKSPPSRNANL
jgi:hypothetical protein